MLVLPHNSLSPTYLSDFVLHGTDQQADDNVQNKIIKDLRSTVKVVCVFCMCVCVCIYLIERALATLERTLIIASMFILSTR